LIKGKKTETMEEKENQKALSKKKNVVLANGIGVQCKKSGEAGQKILYVNGKY